MALDTVIELKNVTVFQKQAMILTHVNIEIEKGEFVYLIGKTGGGKSSLLKMLYGELDLTQGEGAIAGFNLKGLKRKQIPFLRRKLGIIFQDFQLLTDRSVYDNLVFVMKSTEWHEKDKMQQRIQDVLDKVGIGTKGSKMPYELSGGEQQRLAIARALINDPEVILADEPTGNLDPDTSAEIIHLLFDISKTGRAVLMASHDISIMQRFPARTLKCENGKVYDSNVSAA